jgi:hypothetical protein
MISTRTAKRAARVSDASSRREAHATGSHTHARHTRRMMPWSRHVSHTRRVSHTVARSSNTVAHDGSNAAALAAWRGEQNRFVEVCGVAGRRGEVARGVGGVHLVVETCTHEARGEAVHTPSAGDAH